MSNNAQGGGGGKKKKKRKGEKKRACLKGAFSRASVSAELRIFLNQGRRLTGGKKRGKKGGRRKKREKKEPQARRSAERNEPYTFFSSSFSSLGNGDLGLE